MAYARSASLLGIFLALLALPALAHAAGPTLLTYTVAPTTIYSTASSSAALATTTAIKLGFSERVKVSLKIVSASGGLVKSLYSSAGVTNPETKIWDGTSNAGAMVEPGIYTVVVAATSTTSGLALYDTSVAVTVAPPASVEPPPDFEEKTYSIPLSAGWNMVGTPVELTNSSASMTFTPSVADAVWTYDPSNPSASESGWLLYTPGHPELSSFTKVSPGLGYFVHASAPATLSFTGALFAPGRVPPSRTLPGGWSLVGSYATTSESIDDAFASIGFAGLEYTALWGLAPGSSAFVLPRSIEPGSAFWILLDAPHTYAPTDL